MSAIKRLLLDIEERRRQFQHEYEMPTELSTEEIRMIIYENPFVSGKRVVQIMRKFEDRKAEKEVARIKRHRRNQQGEFV